MLANHGIRRSVTVEGFQASRVVISHTDNTVIAGKFAQAGLGSASGSGVPLMRDEAMNSIRPASAYLATVIRIVQDPERALEKMEM
ncbi:hypothetical protein MHM84_18935 [Halomonas sp. McH1-25]|uniref:hypothetical protein n=1 Tax=unclassified Halomonas TaxID=2609666 RepID=UPI001EF5195B|nr:MULTISPECIES: hypothetical protein [unclassified Halomonas]MCG7601837.1 hypothetical protein [Halomonas sp. McH1-25]MCP1343876.1 hypothetical protein [Halomonas sp. FL8]MCP1362017.1 hypothetical protein [Halomonas sp. BBD45]MCP1365105.1 hypothetical protein [Halomonas sp. BBD48]